jgi:histone-arginine methyltransferase CARM1
VAQAAVAAAAAVTRGASTRRQNTHQPAAAGQQQQQQDGADGGGASGSHFDSKTDRGSADLYFHYYGCLQHQQNMLQDYIRTGTYHAAIAENPADFAGKVVMDVGCGSGILSLFAAQVCSDSGLLLQQ